MLRLQLVMSRDDPMPFIPYRSCRPTSRHKTQQKTSLTSSEVQNYCDDNREALGKSLLTANRCRKPSPIIEGEILLEA